MYTLHFFIFAGILIAVAIVSALMRSQVVLIMASLNMATSASVLLLATLAIVNQSPFPLAHGFLIICLSTITNLIFCGVVILIFRSRGTLRLDDYRELRG